MDNNKIEEMKHLIIFSTLIVLCALFIGHISISVKPFSISLPYWHRSIGLVLIVVGFLLFNIGEYTKGYADGLKKGSEMTTSAFKQMLDDIKKQEN